MYDSTFISSHICAQRQLSTLSTQSNEHQKKNIVVWLDAHYDENIADYQISLKALQRTVDAVYPFVDCDHCIDFITEIRETKKKLVLILDGMFAKQLVSIVEDWPQIDAILIFHNDFFQYKEWLTNHPKAKGAFTGIHSLIECLEKIINPDYFAMIDIIGPSSIDSKRLHSSFMYSQLLHEILMDLHTKDESEKLSFVEYCREHILDTSMVDKFASDYELFSPIYWYTAHSFIYDTVNKALRTLDIDMLIRLNFFIGDLQKQLVHLHSKSQQKDRLVVYRGQG
jgi:hypothetical protein